MTKTDISKIEWFIENELKGREESLKFSYEIDNRILIVKFNGDFTSNQEIEIVFKVVNGWIKIIDDDVVKECNTREFWITLMGKLNEQ